MTASQQHIKQAYNTKTQMSRHRKQVVYEKIAILDEYVVDHCWIVTGDRHLHVAFFDPPICRPLKTSFAITRGVDTSGTQSFMPIGHSVAKISVSGHKERKKERERKKKIHTITADLISDKQHTIVAFVMDGWMDGWMDG